LETGCPSMQPGLNCGKGEHMEPGNKHTTLREVQME
jgi:hypothetical protein